MGNTPGKRDDAMLRSLQQNLPVIRKAAKLSQKDLASTLGVSRQTVNNWETDKTFLNPTQGLALMAIIQSFGNTNPSMRMIVDAFFAQQNEARVQAAMLRSPLEGTIARYIEERIAANSKEDDHDEEDKEELSVG